MNSVKIIPIPPKNTAVLAPPTPPIYMTLYAALLPRYPKLSAFNHQLSTLATFAATTAAANSPIFSKPFCCAASARVIVALVSESRD